MNSTLLISDAASVFLVLEDQELSSTLLLEAKTAPALAVLNAGIQGPKGDDGSGTASEPTRVDFSGGATWTALHDLARVPLIFVYLSDGSAILADVSATEFNFTVVHASSRSGFVLLF